MYQIYPIDIDIDLLTMVTKNSQVTPLCNSRRRRERRTVAGASIKLPPLVGEGGTLGFVIVIVLVTTLGATLFLPFKAFGKGLLTASLVLVVL